MKATLVLVTLMGAFAAPLSAQMLSHADTELPLRVAGPLDRLSFSLVPDTSKATAEAPSAIDPELNLPRRASTEFLVLQERTPGQGAMRGTAIGMLIGAGIGYFAGMNARGEECRRAGAGCMVNQTFNAATPLLGTILGASAGAFVGGVIGSVRPGKHWVSVTLPL